MTTARKKCYHCHKLFDEGRTLMINKHRYCPYCLNKLFIKWEDWQLITTWDKNVESCKKCGKTITKQLSDDLEWLCPMCFEHKYAHNNRQFEWGKVVKCLKCGRFHLNKETCECIRQMEQPNKHTFDIWNERQSRYAKGNLTYTDLNVQNVEMQTLIPDNDEINDELDIFYDENPNSHPRYPSHWKDIHDEWEVTFANTVLVERVLDSSGRDKINREKNISRWCNISKYSDMTLTGVKDWKLEWTKINLMWKKTVSYESVNKFLEDHWEDECKAQLSWTYRYVLSNNLEHKLEWLLANDNFRSCQHSGNSMSYALWAYDFITNGCNVPLLIYKEWRERPIGRMLCRLMYDSKWKEYLVVERLYHNWEFWGQGWSDASKWYVQKAIIEDLIKKEYNVVVSPYSAHDQSEYAYMITMWMDKWTPVKNLTQPARILHKPCWYYCDWWTKVKWIEIYSSWLELLDNRKDFDKINKTWKKFTEIFSEISWDRVRLWYDSLVKWYLLSI